MKSIIKEIFIILLLCIAICLIFGIVFYEYIPNSKVVPSTVEAYVTSNTIKDEISQEIVNYPKQNYTYEITNSDLTLYKELDSYDQGKANPFSTYSGDAENTLDNEVNTNTGTGTNTNTNTNKNPDSSDLFFNSTGLK